MISGIKKKFIDILFENDPEQIVEEQPVIEPKMDAQEIGRTLNAKDVLYRKSKSSAFIDLEETIQGTKENEEEEPVRDYEFSQQISPMFGVIRKEHEKPLVVHQPERDEKMVNKPEDSHLDIVTSPFYGYGEQHDHNDAKITSDSVLEEEGFSYDQDDPYMKGLYEHEDLYQHYEDQNDRMDDYDTYDYDEDRR